MDTSTAIPGACANPQKAAVARRICQKNALERKSCDQITKVIDRERQVTCARISRQERDLRDQLERLQHQRKVTAQEDLAGRYTKQLLALKPGFKISSADGEVIYLF